MRYIWIVLILIFVIGTGFALIRATLDFDSYSPHYETTQIQSNNQSNYPFVWKDGQDFYAYDQDGNLYISKSMQGVFEIVGSK